jgi:hypothetical protein
MPNEVCTRYSSTQTLSHRVFRKVKCSGNKPTCAACQKSNLKVRIFEFNIISELALILIFQCLWGSTETGQRQKPLRQYTASLEKHIVVLHAYISDLEARLNTCRALHSSGSGMDDPPPCCTRPVYTPHQTQHTDDFQIGGMNSDQYDDIEQLIAPTKHLKVRAHFTNQLTTDAIIILFD